jgi:hypothetical protein
MIVEFAGYAGFDFVRIDVSHNGFDPPTIINMIRAAELCDVASMVRVDNDPFMINSVLEAGALGVYVPDVSTAEKAKGPRNTGHLFMAIRTDLFVSAEEFRERMDTLIQRVHDRPKAAGFSEILVVGEPESRMEAQRRKNGIPYSTGEFASLLEEAAKAGIAPPPLLR